MATAGHHDHSVEPLVVVRAVVSYLIARCRFGTSGHQFLQTSFVVVTAGLDGRAVDEIPEQATNESPGGI